MCHLCCRRCSQAYTDQTPCYYNGALFTSALAEFFVAQIQQEAENIPEILVHIDMTTSHSSCTICWPDVNLLFHLIPKLLCWIDIWECGGLLLTVNSVSCSIWDDLSFVIWHNILLEAAIRGWVISSHKGTDTVSKNTAVGSSRPLNTNAQLLLRGLKCARKIFPIHLQHHYDL